MLLGRKSREAGKGRRGVISKVRAQLRRSNTVWSRTQSLAAAVYQTPVCCNARENLAAAV